MNNPLLQLANIFRSGGNPQPILNSITSRNPQAGQLIQMLQGKNGDELKQIASNMASERGVTIEQVIQQLGIQ